MALNMLAPFEFVVYQALSTLGPRSPIGIVQSVIEERLGVKLVYQEVHMVMVRGLGKGLLDTGPLPANRYGETRHRCGYTLTPAGKRLLDRTKKVLAAIQGQDNGAGG